MGHLKHVFASARTSGAGKTYTPALVLAIALLGLPVFSATSLPAQEGPLQVPYRLRLYGHLGPARPDEKGTNPLTTQNGDTGKVHQFTLTKLETVNVARLPGQILAEVAPFKPSFFLYAPSERLAKLEGATPEDQLEIIGYRTPGTRDILVATINVGGEQSAPPK